MALSIPLPSATAILGITFRMYYGNDYINRIIADLRTLPPGGGVTSLGFASNYSHLVTSPWARMTIPGVLAALREQSKDQQKPPSNVLTLERALVWPWLRQSVPITRERLRSVEAANPSLPWSWWMMVHALLFSQGYVAAAIEAKCSAARAILHPVTGIKDTKYARLHFAAAVYLGDSEQALRVLGTLKETSVSYRSLQIAWHMIFGDIETARHLRHAHETEVDRRFGNLVGGKSVAVVCPAVNDLSNGRWIDRYDLVVRTNFAPSQALAQQSAMLGSRTDIAYYNVCHFRKRQAQVLDSTPRTSLHAAVFRNSLDAALVHSENIIARVGPLHPAIFFGRGFAAGHILYDLLCFTPGEVRCFGADFFLGEQTHFAGYLPGKIRKQKHAASYSYIRHDPVATWRFMKRMWTLGMISGDTILKDILQLDEAVFCQRLGAKLKPQLYPLRQPGEQNLAFGKDGQGFGERG